MNFSLTWVNSEVLLFSLLIVLPVVIALSWYTIQGAPFVVSRDEDIQTILRLLKRKRGKKAADLGSGDGKLVIALARMGFRVDGYEINPWLVYRSRQAIKKAKLTKMAHIYWKSIWKADFSSYDIVTVYAIAHIMGRISKKLQKELPKGSVVTSNYFTFPDWKPVKEEGRIHLYRT